MLSEEIEHSAVCGIFTQRIAQAAWRQSGQIEKTVGAVFLGQHPAKRRKRQRRRIVIVLIFTVTNCQRSIFAIELVINRDTNSIFPWKYG